MSTVLSSSDDLHRMFAALIENTFQVDLGVADPPMTDYLADMLVRFVRIDAIFRVRDAEGHRLEELAEMMLEAEERQAKPKRELHRHIGDFALFWAGLYPEALKRRCSSLSKDHLIDYCEQGKRSYYIASTFDDEPFEHEAPVLRRLSHDFELCSFGLNRIRQEWGKMRSTSPGDAERN